MIEVVMDTSAIVSLEMIGFLQKSLDIIKIIIPKGVEEEIKEIFLYKDKEGKSAKEILQLIKKDKIKIIGVKNSFLAFW